MPGGQSLKARLVTMARKALQVEQPSTPNEAGAGHSGTFDEILLLFEIRKEKKIVKS